MSVKGWGLEGPACGPWLRRGEESPMGGPGQQPGAQLGVNVWGRVWPGPLSTHFAETTKALDLQETMNSCSQAPASHRLIMEGWLVRSLPFELMAIDFSFHSFPHQPSLRPAPGSERQGCGQRLETLPSRRFAGPEAGSREPRAWISAWCRRPVGRGTVTSVPQGSEVRAHVNVCVSGVTAHTQVPLWSDGCGQVWPRPTGMSLPRCCCGQPTRYLRS